MKSIMMSASIIIMINIIILIILNLTAKKMFLDREKSSPFECGFDPHSTARLPFSLHFFIIAAIFLVFDVEIVLLLPMAITFKSSSMMNFSTIFISFIFTLMAGLFHEWRQGALTWSC
nr:NADH dehydrogenase subunit 3 [Sagra femorata]